MNKISDLDSFFEKRRDTSKRKQEEEETRFEKDRQEKQKKSIIFNNVMKWVKEKLVISLQKQMVGTGDTIIWNSLADEIAAYEKSRFAIVKPPHRSGAYFKLTYKPYNHAPLIINFEYINLFSNTIVCEYGTRKLPAKDSVKKEISFDEFTDEYVEEIIVKALKDFLKTNKFIYK